jgi:hypothetical protein
MRTGGKRNWAWIMTIVGFGISGIKPTSSATTLLISYYTMLTNIIHIFKFQIFKLCVLNLNPKHLKYVAESASNISHGRFARVDFLIISLLP